MDSNDNKKLHLILDANSVRLSEIVKLKNLFHKYPGSAPIHIAFSSMDQKIGVVEVESKWGVGWNSELENRIKSFSFIQDFSFEE